jgi:hypothetical protein
MTQQPPQVYTGTAGVGNLPKSAYTSWIKRVIATLIDGIIPAVTMGIGYGVASAMGLSTNCTTRSDSTYGGSSANCEMTSDSSGAMAALWVEYGLSIVFVI